MYKQTRSGMNHSVSCLTSNYTNQSDTSLQLSNMMSHVLNIDRKSSMLIRLCDLLIPLCDSCFCLSLHSICLYRLPSLSSFSIFLFLSISIRRNRHSTEKFPLNPRPQSQQTQVLPTVYPAQGVSSILSQTGRLG